MLIGNLIGIMTKISNNIFLSDANGEAKPAINVVSLFNGMGTLIEDEGKFRTCNKIEMCRLQGFKDNYCDTISNAKSGSLLGDGWTLPIIIHILSFWGMSEKKEGKKKILLRLDKNEPSSLALI